MKFDELLSIVGAEPVFETSLLLAGDVDPADVRRQLSRWTSSGRLHRLRRGLYALAPPFQKIWAHPFLVANHLVRPSYVSLQSALSFYGAIPEAVPVTTSVTTVRPGTYSTPQGDFVFRHVQVPLFKEYRAVVLSDAQQVFIASPEKALFDLIYLERGSDAPAFLDELRLDLDDSFDFDELQRLSASSAQGKVERAVSHLLDCLQAESAGEIL
jgi:predicted transcriptional regulator of viral defense system